MVGLIDNMSGYIGGEVKVVESLVFESLNHFLIINKGLIKELYRLRHPLFVWKI